MRQTANAFPTCEGALQLAMEQTAFTLQNARCLLTTEVLSDMKPPCFIIDLASLLGGVAADTLLPDGCRVLHALSLPGKVAPLSAARAVFDTVDTILHEEGIL